MKIAMAMAVTLVITGCATKPKAPPPIPVPPTPPSLESVRNKIIEMKAARADKVESFTLPEPQPTIGLAFDYYADQTPLVEFSIVGSDEATRPMDLWTVLTNWQTDEPLTEHHVRVPAPPGKYFYRAAAKWRGE